MIYYAIENTFINGQVLPIYNTEGYALTWYSDKSLTTQITTVSDASVELYCSVGNTVEAYQIESIVLWDCTVVITDGVNIYSQGDMIPANTVLTITAQPITSG